MDLKSSVIWNLNLKLWNGGTLALTNVYLSYARINLEHRAYHFAQNKTTDLIWWMKCSTTGHIDSGCANRPVTVSVGLFVWAFVLLLSSASRCDDGIGATVACSSFHLNPLLFYSSQIWTHRSPSIDLSHFNYHNVHAARRCCFVALFRDQNASVAWKVSVWFAWFTCELLRHLFFL